MKELIIRTENMDDMLVVIDLVRNKIGDEIKFFEVGDEKESSNTWVCDCAYINYDSTNTCYRCGKCRSSTKTALSEVNHK